MLCTPAQALAADPLSLEASVFSRFGGNADGDGTIDPDGDGDGIPDGRPHTEGARGDPDGPLAGLPRRLDLVPVAVAPVGIDCTSRNRPAIAWVVDRRTMGDACPLRINVLAGATRSIEVTMGERKGKLEIAPVAKLVVALGDSVASGEGNKGRGYWLEERCNRSAAAGFEQAARQMAGANARVVSNPSRPDVARPVGITFISMACSGARLDEGLLGPYKGASSAMGQRKLTAQVVRLKEIAAALNRGRKKRKIDAILVSAGANDIFFSGIVFHCLQPGGGCDRKAFRPAGATGQQDADIRVGTALSGIPARYDTLAPKLRAAGVAPKSVLISEYFDPTRNSAGEVCPAIGGATASELRWAQDSVLAPLNEEILAASRRHGWTFVGGISRAFATHGYCSGSSWIVQLPKPLRNYTGVLHPDKDGHLAIAEKVSPPLADVLGLQAPKPEEAEEEEDTVLVIVWLGIMAASTLVLLWFAGAKAAVRSWVERFFYLFRRSRRKDPVGGKPTAPRFYKWTRTRNLNELMALIVKGVGVLGAGILSLGFVVFVGAAVEWVRFNAARYPADQAVDAIGRDELLIVGATALSLFAVLGGVAAILMWVLDGQGKAIRVTRRALGFLVFAELIAALILGEFRFGQALEFGLGFAVIALAAVVVAEAALRGLEIVRTDRPPDEAVGALLRSYVRAGTLRGALDLIPIVLVGVAVFVAFDADHAGDRWIYLVPLLAAAAILFVAPWGIAGKASGPEHDALLPVRPLLAGTVMVCLSVIIARDEWWLAGTVGASVLLATLCLAVARASGTRFLPFALTVFASVGIYGAVATCLRIMDAPETQPAALLLKDGRAMCGFWIGDADGRISLARVELNELGAQRRPRANKASLVSYDESEVVDRIVGPLQPIGRAHDQAAVLRDALIADHPDRTWDPDHTTCKRPASEVKPVNVAETAKAKPAPKEEKPATGPLDPRELAAANQPHLVVDRDDRFWPVSLSTVFRMEDRRATTCRQVTSSACIRVQNVGQLPWSGGPEEFLEYPARADQTDEQHDVMVDALGSADPTGTAREYYLVTQGSAAKAPISLQYWFFYTFNYQPVAEGILKGGFHEGDWESMGVVLSHQTKQPRYVWMARHSNEGRPFVWDESSLEKVGSRVQVYAAKGSHATYERCYRQHRVDAPYGFIDDRPQCKGGSQLHLVPETTPLTDVSRTPWACWPGRYGHRPDSHTFERNDPGHIHENGPEGPLFQQDFGGVEFKPCLGVRDPGGRDRPGEELLPEATSEQIRKNAGTLELLVDDCSDWEKPPVVGVYLVACPPRELRKYFNGGLEDPSPADVHIDVVDPDEPIIGKTTMPAVHRNPRGRLLADWRVTAAADTTTNVYAACGPGETMVEARFTNVKIKANQRLRVDDRLRTVWRLRDEYGAEVARAVPRATRGKPKRLACGA